MFSKNPAPGFIWKNGSQRSHQQSFLITVSIPLELILTYSSLFHLFLTISSNHAGSGALFFSLTQQLKWRWWYEWNTSNVDRFWFIRAVWFYWNHRLLEIKSVWERQSMNAVFTKMENGNIHISNSRAFYEYNKCPLKEHLLLQNGLQTSTDNILFFADSQQFLQS